jgi:peptidoglycan/LPS O-acetylase OafA/YrhL
MRGFAALYVVLFHAIQESKVNSNSSPFWYYVFSQGHTMVTIFIVISGFCLMLPVTKRGLTLSGGNGEFFRRRAYRILPPYYVALGLGIIVDTLGYPRASRMSYLKEPSTVSAVWSHLFMVHNWSPVAIFRFNGPLWSVAMECQIYLLFPLIVAAWRRFGPTPTLIALGILAHAGYYLVGHRVALNYFFIFGLGMLGADLVVRGTSRMIQWVCWSSLIGYLVVVSNNRTYVSDIFVGIFAATLMAALSLGAMAPIRRALSGRAITWLGSFSYSIYLIHSIIQQGYLRTSFAVNNNPLKQMLVLFFGVTPSVLIAAYLFYLVVEKPSIDHAKNIVTSTVRTVHAR